MFLKQARLGRDGKIFNLLKFRSMVMLDDGRQADALLDEGFDLITGGTDNHLMLADLRPMHITGKDLQNRCDENHITLNKNAIPNDPQKPAVTSGVRIGTAAVTTRGLGEEEMKKIAHCVALTAKDFEGTQAEVKATVAEICEQFPMYK